MSERTTIGGTVYEAIGSSSSNLLLRCNGTARILWGGRLIDLIKNGKIASSDSKELIFIVSDESEIKSDGIYVLTTEESPQLLIYKDGNKYDFTSPDLYISASDKQNLTVEQKAQALDNIGIQYDTLEALKQAGIQNGIAYVLETKTLYTIKNSVIEEFEAKLKTVTVENGTSEGDLVNSTDRIVLSILDDEYLILADLRITANYSIHVRNSAQIGSESADRTQGYRLYIEGGTSYLDVDKINVRKGLGSTLYQEITFEDLKQLINNKALVPHEWYLITDFQNHWKLVVENEKFNRPILVRALYNDTLYKKGYLFKNHNIEIEYDPFYEINPILQMDSSGLYLDTTISSRGKITWMRDLRNNNSANFDFLDYSDAFGNTFNSMTLHQVYEELEEEDLSIFPKDSSNNTLIMNNLFGTIVNNEGKFDNNGTSCVNFAVTQMHNNFMEWAGNCSVQCNLFNNNKITYVQHLQITSAEFRDNDLYHIYNTIAYLDVNDFLANFHSLYKELGEELYAKFSYVNFTSNCINNIIHNAQHNSFINELIDCNFTNIKNCRFNEKVEKFTIKQIDPYIDYWGEVFIYEFDEITDSVIEYLSGKVYLSKLINSKLESISAPNEADNDIVITGTLENCVIKNISNKVNISSDIKNSFIEFIEESTLSEEIDNCTFNYVKLLTLTTSLVNSTFGKISESEINGVIENSSFTEIDKSKINNSITNSNFKIISETTEINGTIDDSNFDNINNSILNGNIINSTFSDISNITFNAAFNNVKFRKLTGGIIGEGSIARVVSFYDLNNLDFNQTLNSLLYNEQKRKEIYIILKSVNGVSEDFIHIVCVPDALFYRGMIIMHSGILDIPDGWALCDGNEYEWDGVKSRTPDLRNRFIKATETIDSSEVKATDNNNLNENGEIVLTTDNLPVHSHPHKSHIHTFSDSGTAYDTIGALTDSEEGTVITAVEGGTEGKAITKTTYTSAIEVLDSNVLVEGDTSSVTSEESDWLYKTEPDPINTMPNYYSLIFIMKL